MNTRIAEFYEDRLGRELTEGEHDALRQWHEALGAERVDESHGGNRRVRTPEAERVPALAGTN